MVWDSEPFRSNFWQTESAAFHLHLNLGEFAAMVSLRGFNSLSSFAIRLLLLFTQHHAKTLEGIWGHGRAVLGLFLACSLCCNPASRCQIFLFSKKKKRKKKLLKCYKKTKIYFFISIFFEKWRGTVSATSHCWFCGFPRCGDSREPAVFFRPQKSSNGDWS